jgi:hypothetical protein
LITRSWQTLSAQRPPQQSPDCANNKVNGRPQPVQVVGCLISLSALFASQYYFIERCFLMKNFVFHQKTSLKKIILAANKDEGGVHFILSF